MRFDERASHATRIKYMTDGMLVREALVDPQLSRYKVLGRITLLRRLPLLSACKPCTHRRS